MKQKSRLQWLPIVFMAVGVFFLGVGMIIFMSPPAGNSAQLTGITPASPTLPTAPTPTAVLSPTPVTFNSPLPAPAIISPLPTPTSPPPTTAAVITTSNSSAATFNGEAAYQQVLGQVALGPRPTGSEAGWATGDYILAELQKVGWTAETQEFIFKGVKGRNIIAKRGSGPIIILGAHYDTRPAADKDPDPAKQGEWIEGANDGASGVAVLLELARVLDSDKLKNEIWLTFFDAEDRGKLDGWPFSVGARHMAQNLAVMPQSMVLVDMVGDADQNIYLEGNSTPALRDEIWAVAAELGYQEHIIPQPKYTIIDDHIPFLERGIPAVDMIDFDYPAWHTTGDTADKVAPASLERVGRTLEVWLKK